MPINNLWNPFTRGANSSQAAAPPTMPSPSSSVGEGNSCPGISITYSCGHTWLEHGRECATGNISRCPRITAESMRPEFACLTCGPLGSDNPSRETILKARTLGADFEYWVNSLIKGKNDALQKVEENKVEISKLRKEAAELKTAVEKLKESEVESKKMVKALQKHQVKDLNPFQGKMAPPPLPIKGQGPSHAGTASRKMMSKGQSEGPGQSPMVVIPTLSTKNSQTQGLAVQAPPKKAPVPKGPGLSMPPKPAANNQAQSQRKWSFTRPEGVTSDFDDVVVMQQYKDCDHSDRVFLAKRGKSNPMVAKAVIQGKKPGLCAKCVKSINSSEKEKVQALQKELGTNFDKVIDDFYDNPQPPKRTSSGKIKPQNSSQPRGNNGKSTKAVSFGELSTAIPSFPANATPSSPANQANANSIPRPTTPQSKSKATPQPSTPKSTSKYVYEPTPSQLKAKEVVKKYFAEPFQEIVDDLKTQQKNMVDTNYGIFVIDNVVEMELALRKGDERQFLVKKNEIFRNRKDIEKDLGKFADTFGEDIMKEAEDCLANWIDATKE